MRRAFFFIFIIISVILPSEQARASLRFGNGGRIVPQRWNPLWVSMERPPERGRVEIRVLRYGAPPALESYPLDSNGRAECPIYMDSNVEAIEVGLREGNRVIGSERIDPWRDAFPGHVVLTSGVSSGARMAIAGVLLPFEPVHVASLSPAEFPHAAVDYDGASAVVLDGDDLSLNPAQRDALRVFIAGGGVLLLAGPRPERFNAIDPGFLAPEGGSGAAYGNGRIVLLERDSGYSSASRSADFWKGILGFGPFETSRRVTSSSFIGSVRSAEGAASGAKKKDDTGAGGPPVGIAIVIAAWAAAASFLLFIKRRRILVVVAVSALSFIGLASAGRAFGRAWRRGVSSEVRVIALPEGSGVIADVRLKMRTVEAYSSRPGTGSPRMARISLEDAEDGVMDPVLPFEWRHEFRIPYLSVVSTSAASLRMGGILPAAVLSGAAAWDEGSPEFAEAIRSGACIVLGRDGEFRSGITVPAWAAERMGWMRSVAEAFHGMDVAFGFDPMPSLGLMIQGATPGPCLWARPMRGI